MQSYRNLLIRLSVLLLSPSTPKWRKIGNKSFRTKQFLIKAFWSRTKEFNNYRFISFHCHAIRMNKTMQRMIICEIFHSNRILKNMWSSTQANVITILALSNAKAKNGQVWRDKQRIREALPVQDQSAAKSHRISQLFLLQTKLVFFYCSTEKCNCNAIS